MKINIKANPEKAVPCDFNYSNIKSSYGYNTQFFTKNNKPFMPITGELHFSRIPKARWRETLLKMRECGCNTVSTYVFWNYHEENKNCFDFKGNKDISAFLSLCQELTMPCVLRIGPWDHGEVVYGGFPKRIQKMRKKRSDSPEYLNEVYDFWKRLYQEVKSFLDGETVIGIQIENEFPGDIEHLKTLKKIAEKIGYKTPFFTMTAWPTGKPDKDFLPMLGGYPDAPWTHGRFKLKPNNRFAIKPLNLDEEIGIDLIKNNKTDESAFSGVPSASCEIGPGNQVTQHRRPFISEKDGYGVGFAKLASGMNWLGYYMFCGGTNPNDRLMQESRITGYPNNYPIIDYDFQAPISRYGVCRAHGDRLRLMHLFINSFDKDLPVKQPFFPKYDFSNPDDSSFLRCSVRVDDNLSGYFFVSAYEKFFEYQDFNNVNVDVVSGDKIIKLPEINVKAGSMFFYPFNMKIGNTHFDYILAQPVAKTLIGNKTICYFIECEGIVPRYSVNGVEKSLAFDENGTDIGDVRIVVIPYNKAKKFHFINDKAYFINGTVYCDNGKIYCEKSKPINSEHIKLKKIRRQSLLHNYYLYSNGLRKYYELTLPENILENCLDISLEFYFEGLNLQVFSGKTLINDYFNIDKKFTMHLRDYKQYLENNNTLIIKTAPKTKFGISAVYSDIPIPVYSNKLVLSHVDKVKCVEVK